MATYTVSKSITIHDTVETAAAGLETLLDATDTGKNNIYSDIIRIEANKYAAVLVCTDES